MFDRLRQNNAPMIGADELQKINRRLNNKGNLVGIGLGLGLNTKTGLLKFAFANGIDKNQAAKSYNTIIHISYNVEF